MNQKGLTVVYKNFEANHPLYYLIDTYGLAGIITEEMPESLKTNQQPLIPSHSSPLSSSHSSFSNFL